MGIGDLQGAVDIGICGAGLMVVPMGSLWVYCGFIVGWVHCGGGGDGLGLWVGFGKKSASYIFPDFSQTLPPLLNFLFQAILISAQFVALPAYRDFSAVHEL
ncbi:hypothetical protein CMV_002937 [Castanea mollissima]|uniref:Uncharacterized protein n=1 Tax=Castanea mollissima TaxID=60419 RepID=A0A8J4RVA5_9ROSI|nr:hypothetical protein CMV_002937 [Castanea mollissima]